MDPIVEDIQNKISVRVNKIRELGAELQSLKNDKSKFLIDYILNNGILAGSIWIIRKNGPDEYYIRLFDGATSKVASSLEGYLDDTVHRSEIVIP